MSNITKLTIKNIRSLRQGYDLAPFTYIWGPNKSNKSTIADAIRIAILGNFPKPGVPKTNEGVMYLASDSTLEASIQFGDGRKIHRRFWKEGDSTKSVVDPKGYTVDARLAMCLDTSLYFGKTDSERVHQVINMSEAKNAAELVPGIMAKLKMLKAKEHDEGAEKALGELINALPVHKVSMTVQQWLGDILKWARETYTQVNASLKNLDGTSRTLTEANAIDVLSEFTTLDQLKAEQQRLKDKQLSLSVSFGRRKELAQRWEENQRRRTKLLGEKAALANTETSSAKAQELQAAIENENKLLEGVFSEIAELESTQSSMESEYEELDNKNSRLVSDQAKLLSQQERFNTQLEEIDRVIKHFTNSSECPTCHAKTPGWKQPAIDEQEANKTVTKALLNGIIPHIAEFQSALREVDAALMSNLQVSKGVVLKLTALRLANTARQNTINAKRSQLDELGKLGMRSISIDEQLTAIGELGERPNDKESPEASEIKRRMFEVETKSDILVGQERERERIKQVEVASAIIRAKVEIVKQIGEVIKAEQAAIVEGAFKPVLDVANALADGILPTPLAYKDGLVGRMDKHAASGFIPVGAFSGSEERLAFAAITAGLASTAEDKIAIIDELGTFDLDSQAQLLRNIDEAICKGMLDQVFIIGTVRPAVQYSGPMYKIIDTHES